ncbi:lanthionine synthetase LanC family protein [Nonomuraea sp. NPDC003201]
MAAGVTRAGRVDAALALTRAHGFGRGQCLCHGDFGNLELLLQTAQLRNDPELRAEAAGLPGVTPQPASALPLPLPFEADTSPAM